MKASIRLALLVTALALLSNVALSACQAGQISVETVCTSCKNLDAITTGSQITPNICTCPTGMVWSSTDLKCQCRDLFRVRTLTNTCLSCKTVANADPLTRESYQTCSCLSGTVWNPTLNLCACQTAGSVVVAGVCAACQTIKLADPAKITTTNGTACFCQPNSQWIKTTGQCECNSKLNFAFNPELKTCDSCSSNIRKKGKAIDPNTCLCNLNSAWDAALGDCICKSPIFTLATTGGSCVCDFANSYIRDARTSTASLLKCKLCSTILNTISEPPTALNTCNCKEGYLWNSTTSACTNCDFTNGFVLNSKGSCVVCTDITVKGVDPATTPKGSCNCAENAVWNATKRACECKAKYAFNAENVCICDSSKKYITNAVPACVLCNDPTVKGVRYTDVQTCACPSFATFVDKVCVCGQGYVWSKVNVAKPTCVCDFTAGLTGKIANLQGTCVECTDPSLQGLSLLPTNDKCLCPQYSDWTVGKSIKQCKCRAFRIFTDQGCTCDPSAARISNAKGDCVRCNDPTVNGLDFVSAELCRCPIDTTWDETTKFCKCSDNAKYNATTKRCVCDSSKGAVLNKDGICVPCTDPTVNGLSINTLTSSCICKPFASWNLTTRSCVCLKNYSLNAELKCVCDPEKTLITLATGTCSLCTGRGIFGVAFVANQSCTCLNNLTWSATKFKCVCEGTNQVINSVVPANAFCQCQSGYVRNQDGACVLCSDSTINKDLTLGTPNPASKGCTCKANAIWNATQFKCLCSTVASIFATTTACIDCAKDTNSLKTVTADVGCICKSNFKWDSTLLICKCDYQAGFFTLKAGCVACTTLGDSATGVATSDGCTCATSYKWSATLLTCVCDPLLSFKTLEGGCALCAGTTHSQSTAVNNVCVCKDGYTWDATARTCSVCTPTTKYKKLADPFQCTLCTTITHATGLATANVCACKTNFDIVEATTGVEPSCKCDPTKFFALFAIGTAAPTCNTCVRALEAAPATTTTPATECGCVTNAVWDATTKTCKCDPASKFALFKIGGGTGAATCNTCVGSLEADPVTTTTPATKCGCVTNAEWSATTNTCICNPVSLVALFAVGGTGAATCNTCVGSLEKAPATGTTPATKCGCVTNAEWDATTNICICNPVSLVAFFAIGTGAATCNTCLRSLEAAPVTGTIPATECGCVTNAVWDATTKTCKCDPASKFAVFKIGGGTGAATCNTCVGSLEADPLTTTTPATACGCVANAEWSATTNTCKCKTNFTITTLTPPTCVANPQ